jgi:hypothetical protein
VAYKAKQKKEKAASVNDKGETPARKRRSRQISKRSTKRLRRAAEESEEESSNEE